jgi:hypothetical protein
MALKFKLPFQSKVQDAVFGRRLPDWSSLPEMLRTRAQRNEYLPANPYPVEKLVAEFQGEPFITRQTKIVTIGSCFAEELNKWLNANGYTVAPQVWGQVYTPQNIAQIVRYAFEPETWQPEEPFWVMSGKYHDPYLKGLKTGLPAYLGDSEGDARQALAAHYEQSAQVLGEAELVVWTLGLTELWRNSRDHAAYFRVPYPDVYNPARHEFYALTYEDVRQHLDDAITRLGRHNPRAKILLSVSPVPLHVSFRDHLGPYVATQYSKSVLHAAALATVERHTGVYYMPSYEITRINPLVNYKRDGRHINPECVDSIMTAFKTLYVRDGD